MKSALCLLIVACLGGWRVWQAKPEVEMALTNSLQLSVTSAISGYVQQVDDTVTRKVLVRDAQSTEFTYGTGIGKVTQYYSDNHSGATTTTLTFSNSSLNDVKADALAITGFKYLRVHNKSDELLFLTGGVGLVLADVGATSLSIRPGTVFKFWMPGNATFPNGYTPTMTLILTAVVGNIDADVEIAGS